jgi:hypothetical protein
MTMNDDGMMRPRKMMAGAEDSGDFGVGPISRPRFAPMVKDSEMLADKDRAAPPAFGGSGGSMASTPAADHGPHSSRRGV